MIRPDAVELQGRPSRPEMVAGFIRAKGITIQPVNGGEQGVDEYHFLQQPRGLQHVTIGIVSFTDLRAEKYLIEVKNSKHDITDLEYFQEIKKVINSL